MVESQKVGNKALIDLFTYKCCRCGYVSKDIAVDLWGTMPSWNCVAGPCGGEMMIIIEKHLQKNGKYKTIYNPYIPEKKEVEKIPYVFDQAMLDEILNKFKKSIFVPIPMELRQSGMRDSLNLITHAIEDKLGKTVKISDVKKVWVVQ